tara:strand:+ start:408 stop:776 length:369 start_codon:yes stop_codon:yes gene_type:complete
MEHRIKHWVFIDRLCTYQHIVDDIHLLISIHRLGGSKRVPEFLFNIDLVVENPLGNFSHTLLQGKNTTQPSPYKHEFTQGDSALISINHLQSKRLFNSFNDIKTTYANALQEAIKYLWPQVT